MLRRTALNRLAVPTAAVLTIGLAIPALHAAAAPSEAEECVQAGNVWVHVEYDETVAGACATEFASAQEAILSTGVTADDTWIQTVDGRLSEGTEWWSVYFMSPNDDGTYPGEWEFAEVGVGELEMYPSEVLALKLQADYNFMDQTLAPAVNPVEGVVLTAEEPAPRPSVSQSPAPSAPPSVSASPTVSASPVPVASPSASVEVTATAAPSRPGLPKTGH
ncbi:hypothetical protein [Tessaracoccus sp. MC1756]|uniref:hypothetical protein n=1 Tax=Tessaracoccus sp. MC1756 TaxID=2760311 RepID=UPI0015FF3918|nr:hypothetical protein [Tessaracoccus sp. MC1756]MBB1510813.1 hypothetical protein [Tessaracoccus sp. MC1756]